MSESIVTAPRTNEIIARLEHVERALFGSILVAKETPPTPPPQHSCIPAIVQPNISESARRAVVTVADLIEREEKKLRCLRDIERAAQSILEKPSSFTAEVLRVLHECHDVVNSEYAIDGDTPRTKGTERLAEKLREAVGILSGDQVPLSDGTVDAHALGHVWVYLDDEKDIKEAIGHATCELCLPNLMAMVEADIARGLIRVTDGGRYEWVGQ